MLRRPSISALPLAAALVVLSSAAAFAHPGHGTGLADGLAHPFTGIDHMLAMVAVGLWAAQLGGRAIFALPLVFPAMMAGGAMLGINGAAMPWAEIGIVASVLVLGAAVALNLRIALAASAALVGVFAVFHGYAHGAELTSSGSPLLYFVGFILATVALHAIGIAAGLVAQRPSVMRAAGGAIAAAGLLLFIA